MVVAGTGSGRCKRTWGGLDSRRAVTSSFPLGFASLPCGFLTLLPLCLLFRPKALIIIGIVLRGEVEEAGGEIRGGGDEKQTGGWYTYYLSHVIIVLRCDDL